jgi:hypothetical protein
MLPVRVRSQRSTVDERYWVAKAALGIDNGNGGSIAMLGFGCKTEKAAAEATAYYECLEHYFGSYFAYSAKELSDLLEVRNLDHTLAGTHVKRSNVLVGSQTKRRRNATGLAIGISRGSAVRHAELELYERHISHSWWVDGRLQLTLLSSAEDSHSKTLTLALGLENFVYVASAQIGWSVPFFVIGTCCAETLEAAVEHANEERVMLWEAAFQIPRASGMAPMASQSQLRLSRSLTRETVDRWYTSLQAKMYASQGSPIYVAKQIREAKPTYCEIFSDGEVIVVRCKAAGLADASLPNAAKDRSDAPFF